MKKTDPEYLRLAAFIEDNIPVDALMKAKAFPKGTRRKDYEAIAAKICYIFGYQSIYEYMPPEIIDHPGANCSSIIFPGSVDKDGKYQEGAGGHISTYQSEFDCPACSCHQEIRETKSALGIVQRCVGCKRPLYIVHDMHGNLVIMEKPLKK